MRTVLAIAAAAACLSTTDALYTNRRQEGHPRVIHLTTEKNEIPDPVSRDRLRRRGTVEATLDNKQTLYFANATIGTPAQSVRLHIDTGSSDLWVNTPSSRLCLANQRPCASAGTYTANSSSTYGYVGSYFNISYVDGSGASGDYVTDTVTIGSQKVNSLQFGVGYKSTSAQGILGIGYEINEVQVGRARKSAYRNLPSQLKSDGAISSNSYSLWLNDRSAKTGNILFGGIDTARFVSPLKTLPIQQNGGVYSEFLITLTEMSVGSDVIAKDMALAVLLDSGSSLSYLPDTVVEDIYARVGAQYEPNDGVAYIPCRLATSAASTALNFTFTDPSIVVDLRELTLDLVTPSGERPVFANSTEAACLFGIAPAGSSTNVLGDTFLRSAYVVYDLDNNEVSLAQTVYNATASSVQEIATGTSGIPGAVRVSNPVAATSGVSRGTGNSGIGLDNAGPTLFTSVTPVAAVGAALLSGFALLLF